MSRFQQRGVLTLVLAYTAISGLWIIFSDRAVHLLAPEGSLNLTLQTYKGWFFVLVTALLAYWVLAKRERAIARGQRELATSEERYRVLVETTGTGYVILDQQGLVLDANREYVRLAGYEGLEQIRGRSVMAWTAETDREKGAAGVAACVAQGRLRNLEVDHVDRQGRLIPIEINATAVTTDGQIRVLALCRDISERRQAEQQRRQLEAQLIQAQKMDAIGTLAGGIAHDFNNLLGGVFGYIDMAAESVENGDLAGSRQCLSLAMAVFDRTKALTGQLLTFSKGGAPVKRTVDLGLLLKETTNFALAGANVGAEFRIASQLWPCDVDEHQISQVIDNLVINARQAMPAGGTIVIEAQNLSPGAPLPAALKPGPYVRISIKDQGTGIAKEHLARIFEPFFTTKQTGSGLGLATSYSIVARHGGHLLADSELGRGTIMTVYLPASLAGQVQSRASAAVSHHGHGRALLMDDEPHIRDVTGRMLASMGYEVTAACDGAQVVELFSAACSEGRPFDLVMLDLTVPGGLGGKEVVERLLALAPQCRVIASSGYSEDPVMADPTAFGFSGKIAKPYTRSELARVLQTVMG